ncbi:MAG: hypothetical protein GY847_28085 [Proteobacteria bacterium]|nr:hypothetical protein [Pseudomonadota bacterium]
MRNFCTVLIFFVFLTAVIHRSASAQETDGPYRVELPDETNLPEKQPPPKNEPPVKKTPLPRATPPSASPTPPQTQPSRPPQQLPPAYRQPSRTTLPPSQTPATAPAPRTTTSQTSNAPKQPTLMQEPLEEREEKEEIFAFASFAPEVGYLFFPKSEMVVRGFKATVETRNGFIGKFHLDIGGDGLSFEISPMFAIEAGGITPEDVEFTSALSNGSFKAVGGQIGLVYRFELGHFFPSIGLGFHGDYLMGDAIEYGTELYGRVPIGFTLYMGKHVGLVVETGLMYGVTGIRARPRLPAALDTMDPQARQELETAQTRADFEIWYDRNQDAINDWISQQQQSGELPAEYDSQRMAADFAQDQIAESIRFGQGFGMDIMIGLRFP